MVISAQEFLKIVANGCRSVPGGQIARASVIGKNEGLFRDLALVALSAAHPDLLVRAEWDTPREAFERWSNLWPIGNRSKGIVDLAAVPMAEPLSDSLALGAEFKFWYWFDLLDTSKYAKEGRSYHHLISQSFLMDATKLAGVVPEAAGSRLVVTVVPTFHIDEIPFSGSERRGDFLVERGFPKSYIGNSKVNSKKQSKSTHELRDLALNTFTDYLHGQGCKSVVGGNIVGSHQGLTVTTDFVVTEVPADFRPLC